MNKILLLSLIVAIVSCARVPSPVCRYSPLPSVIPVSIGETLRLDLQYTFQGYNLSFANTTSSEHISITPKFTSHSSPFDSSFNFTNAKINDRNRFIGIATHANYTTVIAFGTNRQDSGIIIQRNVTIQIAPNFRCYDAAQIFDSRTRTGYAIVDCAQMENGELRRNKFLFINLTDYKVIEGSLISDVFVPYNHLKNRNIQVMTDPFTNVEYLLRFYTREGVDPHHENETYVQIFMMPGSIMDIQIIEVIDHTLLNLPRLSILDYQIHMHFIYLLVKDQGLYQINLTPTQRLQRTAYFTIKMDVNRFRVEQNGFNDDLHVVISNGNTVYQYEWDSVFDPVPVAKYALMGSSIVEDLYIDENLIIVQAWCNNGTSDQQRVFIFSRRTLSYMSSFISYIENSNIPAIMVYLQSTRSLVVIGHNRSFNIRLQYPYLTVRPTANQKPGQEQQYRVVATSRESTNSTSCSQTFRFRYIENTDTSIIKTGLSRGSRMIVDAPDDTEINLQYQFFGRNMSYQLTFSVNDVNEKVPQWYVEKRVRSRLILPQQLDKAKIIYYQIFLEASRQELDDVDEVFGIFQVQETYQGQLIYPIYYLFCRLDIDRQFANPQLRCSITYKENLKLGKILKMSQMFSQYERTAGIIFQSEPQAVHLYTFYPYFIFDYGTYFLNYQFENLISSVSVTMKNLVLVTFELGKRIQVLRANDIANWREKSPQPIWVINHQTLFGVNYFAPVKTKISIYHDEVAFVQTKTGVMAININEAGFAELLFNITTNTPKYAFEVNHDTLVIVTETEMSIYRLNLPLRRGNSPFLLQKFTSSFNLNQYDEINSDGLFYLVEKNNTSILVLHANMPSTSILYSQLYVGNIQMIDVVRFKDKEALLLYNGTNFILYLFALNPTLRMRWQPDQQNFTMNLTARNQRSTSEPYQTNVTIIPSNEASIEPTSKFNQTAIKQLGHFKTDSNQKKINKNITLNDSQWFTGNIFDYKIKCKDCSKSQTDDGIKVSLQNHLTYLDHQIRVGDYTFDMHSTYFGTFGQMFSAFFKTYSYNDNIQYVANIPINAFAACSKMAVHQEMEYLLSFCETGGTVHVYISTLNSLKPFTFGPYITEAKAANHVEIVQNVVMIVDNSDDPFIRSGGVYLYYINFFARLEEDIFTMIDYLDYGDLQIEGFRGIPYIASADIHRPFYYKQEYTVFITEARTGDLFIFLFQMSDNKKEAVYLQRRRFRLNQKIAQTTIAHPQPLRIINVNIIDFSINNNTSTKRMQIQYVILLTVKNWHHIEIMVKFDEDYDELSFELTRLFERVPYPWQLTNYIKVRKGALNASYFGITYKDFTFRNQILAVYYLPYFHLPLPQQNSSIIPHRLQANIPVTKSLGGYPFSGLHDLCFSFNVRNEHRILYENILDWSYLHLNQIQLNKQLKIVVKDIDTSDKVQENLTIIAENHYMNFSFLVELKKIYDDDNPVVTEDVIIWIIVLAIGSIMILGLLCVWLNQSRKTQPPRESRQQSLLTVDSQYKSARDSNSVANTAQPKQNIQVEEELHEQTGNQATKPLVQKEQNKPEQVSA